MQNSLLNVSLSNCSKYFNTAFDMILAMANDFNFSLAVTYRQTNSMIGSSFCHVLRCYTIEDRHRIQHTMDFFCILFSIIGCIVQHIESASFLWSSSTLVVSKYVTTTLLTDEYEMTSTSSQSEPISIFESSSLCGCLLKASAALLDLPVQ